MDNYHNSMQENNSSVIEAEVSVTDNVKAEKYKRLFQSGCQWAGVGVMILGISFGINFMFFDSEGVFIPLMYVMTSLGAICTMKGLLNMFGGW